MKLISNWRDAPRMYSIWALAAITTIQGGVLALLSQTQLDALVVFMPGWTWGELLQSTVAFLAITGGIGRLITQDIAQEVK